jgi:transposase
LLVSIPGIGSATAAVWLAEIGSIEDDRNARQLAAHAGLTPSERSSGTSVRSQPRLSRIAFGILKSKRPFDPNYSIATP